jgi:hypothetical protein
VNKLLILVVALILSTFVYAQDKSIYLNTQGDTFKFKNNKLTKVSIQLEHNKIKLQQAFLPKNEIASLFQSLKQAGCQQVNKKNLSNFSPYDDFKHFSRYFELLTINKELIAIVDKNTPKSKTIAIYNQGTSSVCSTGIYADAVFFDSENSNLYFAKCENDSCIVSRINGVTNQTKLDKIMSIQGDVVDIGYDSKSGNIIVLVRKFKEIDGFFGKLLSKVGHGREKYDLFTYTFNTKTNKEISHLIVEDIVNPTFWIDQSWMQ